MDVVVGSGPAGIAVATALLARGRKVTMIDGGKALSPVAEAQKAKMAAMAPIDWTAQHIAEWQTPQFDAPEGLSQRYGSDHAQVSPLATFDEAPDGFELRASHAIGGLSAIWGAAVLPSRQSDIESWPISTDDLAPHYQAIKGIIPIAGRKDRLQALLPALLMDGHHSLTPGPQGRVLLYQLDKVGDALASEGVYVGQARQAVRLDCQYCGMCLHGCPWDHIFSADQHLKVLNDNPYFSHLPGRLVTRFSEQGERVDLHLQNGETITGEKLYLAAGVLETSRIALASHPHGDVSLTLRDSQHFFLPFLYSWKADGRPDQDPHHTLTEAFIEIDDPQVSPYLTHSQIYSWNEFYARDMIANYGSKLPGSDWLFRAISRRLLVAQTFLHSDHCASIKLRLSQESKRLSIELEENIETRHVIHAAKRKLAGSLRHAGLHALSFASRTGAPGASFHSGGTLPMSETPRSMQTDKAGRLHGSERVHVVDASVLPSIPATTITLTVMANAHRIGALA